MALRETLNRISRMDAPTNEQSTIMKIIQPVLSDLDWNSNEVEYEYQVSPLKGSGKVDIALMGKGGQCVGLVEAKSPRVNLDDYVMQLFRYDASNESGTVCVLTDGLEWRFYLPREKEGNPEERQFARLRLQEDPVERIAEVLEKFLSRSAVVSGEAKNDAAIVLKQLREKSDIDRRLPEIWHQMLTEPDRKLVTWVGKKISDEHGINPSAEQVAKIIVATTHYNLLDQKFNHQVQGTRRQAATVVREVDKRPIGYTLFGDYKPWRSGIGMWADVVKEVYYRHENDFLGKSQQLRLSRSILFLRNGLLISHDRDKINRPRGPIKPRGTSVPVYIERSLKVDICIELAYELLKTFGHPASDLQIHE